MTYWYEKYAVIAVGNWFEEKGFDVRISVPGKINGLMSSALGGKTIPQVATDDFKNPQHRYTVYYDVPGTIDLVARNKNELWIIQAKGISTRSNAPGMIAQAIGQVVLLMTHSEPSIHYGLILPDNPNFLRVLRQIEVDNPVFTRSDWHLFLVSEKGDVTAINFQEFFAKQKALDKPRI
jgi:hypothetical protein